MPDTNNADSKREDVLSVVLCLVGLAGLVVSAAFVAGGRSLWPSFSGERVYMAAQLLKTDESIAAPAPAARAVAAHEVTVSAAKTEGEAVRACGASSRDRQAEQLAARRALARNRARQLSRRPTTARTPTV